MIISSDGQRTVAGHKIESFVKISKKLTVYMEKKTKNQKKKNTKKFMV